MAAVRITLRADSDFCRDRLLRWYERNVVHYVTAPPPRNARLNALAAAPMAVTQPRFETTGEKQRGFAEFRYAAGTWNTDRRVILRSE